MDSEKKSNQKTLWLKIISALTSAFMLVCFSFFMAMSIALGGEFLPCFLAVLGIAIALGALIALYFHKKVFSFFLSLITVIFTVLFFTLVIATSLPTSEELPEGECVVVVFGAHTNGYIPGKTLSSRLLAVSEYLKENPMAVCIVTGASGLNEGGVSEADSMKNYLVGRGIEAGRIICEDKSTTTIQNLEYAQEIIISHGLEGLPIVLATSDFHSLRVGYLATECVAGVYSSAELYHINSHLPSAYYFFSNYTREILAIGKLIITSIFT